MYEGPTEIIRRAGMYLKVAMPDAKAKLTDHLRMLDSVRLDVAETKADWGKLLAEKKNQMLHPKDKDLTDMDRRIMMNASVAVIERDYNFLCDIDRLLGERIDLGKLLLTNY